MQKVRIFLTSFILIISLASCGSDAASVATTSTPESTVETSVAAEEVAQESEAAEPISETSELAENKEEQGSGTTEENTNPWNGTWTDGETAVEIQHYNDTAISVYIDDIEVHTSPDTIAADGNTITCTYFISHAMYPPDMDTSNMPEQEWIFVLTHDGEGISYSRTAILTWYNQNEDGTYGHEVVKEHSTYLTK